MSNSGQFVLFFYLGWLIFPKYYLYLHTNHRFHLAVVPDTEQGYRIMTIPSSETTSSSAKSIVLQEKWTELIKKRPVIYTLCTLFFVGLPLALMFLFLFTEPNSDLNNSEFDKKYVGIALFVFSLLFYLLLNIRIIKRIFAPRQYKVTVDGDNLVIERNGKNEVSISGDQITFFKIYMQGKTILSLRIDYTDDNSYTKRYVLPLDFITRDKCNEFLQVVDKFYSQHVDQRKLTDGENWNKNFIIFLILTIIMAIFYASKDPDERSSKFLVALIIGCIGTVISLVKVINKSNKDK